MIDQFMFLNPTGNFNSNQLFGWNKLVSEHPLGEVYHTSYWQKVIAKTFNYKVLFLVKRNGTGDLSAGLPVFKIKSPLIQNRLCVLPGAQHCDPLVDNQQDYDTLIKFLVNFGEAYKFKYIELRTSSGFKFNTEQYGSKINGYSTYVLNLDRNIDEIRQGLHKSCVLRPLKKALRNGLELKVGHSQSEAKTFYNLYLSMRKEKGLLPQPYKLFSNMVYELGRQNLLDIYLCIRGDTVISGILLLKFRDKVIYEYGATLPEGYQYNASHYLLWNAIINAVRQGYKKFDFGRTGDDNATLATFKSRWGAERVDLVYYYIPEIESAASLRQKGPLKKLMGQTVRNSPLIFSRMLGNFLYRYLI